MRVWQSEKNRSDGAAAPSKKLELDNPETRSALLAKSSIDASQIMGWGGQIAPESRIGTKRGHSSKLWSIAPSLSMNGSTRNSVLLSGLQHHHDFLLK